jgi:hypothetical protein
MADSPLMGQYNQLPDLKSTANLKPENGSVTGKIKYRKLYGMKKIRLEFFHYHHFYRFAIKSSVEGFHPRVQNERHRTRLNEKIA